MKCQNPWKNVLRTSSNKVGWRFLCTIERKKTEKNAKEQQGRGHFASFMEVQKHVLRVIKGVRSLISAKSNAKLASSKTTYTWRDVI